MSSKNKIDHCFQIKFGSGKKNLPHVSGLGRRSGKDRRKLPVRDYLLNGCVERRSWSERRFIWYMTM
jgi:hypothetical protein